MGPLQGWQANLWSLPNFSNKHTKLKKPSFSGGIDGDPGIADLE